ncbi:MFS transporter [Paenibacillus sp.]|jgi:EmrB/QacA subfamily drug resistance transporter|uniref:MFS transporter n=1 Tax=Paenibacillus sp. TaxID=58172 RepID=UPI00282B34E4|nr:MFS transporter [Paenibacillus sp.]MDR0267419.1 MFS transporter [Paenibacillus sp.]
MSDSRNKWGILQVVNMGTLISTLDVGIVNVSLPVMARQFSVSLAQIQWVATVYLLTLVILLPFMGKMSDRMERRKVYGFGFLIFGIGSLCIALSHSFMLLMLSRCLQGIGATMIMANSQAMVRQAFPDHERGRALGYNAIVISVGTLSGPALGGLLMEVMDWTWLFWINVPISFAACWLGFRWFPRGGRVVAKTPFDYVGTFLLGAGVCLLMLAAEAVKDGTYSLKVWLEGGIGILLLCALVVQALKIDYGIIDRELFKHRKVWLGNTGSLIINLAQTATLIPITFYLQSELGFSAWWTGAMLMLQPLLMGIVAPFAGWFRDKYGGTFPINAGAVLCSLSMLFVVFMPSISAWSIGLHLAVFGIGTGLFHATNNAEVMSAAPVEKSSLAGSLLALVRYLGQIVGIGLATLLVGSMGSQTQVPDSFGTPLRVLFGICCLLCLAVAVSGRYLPKEKPQSSNLSAS